MFIIQQITTDSDQKQTLILSDGTQILIELYFSPMQYGWFITSLTYGDFVLQGLRITNSPNMLQQFKNQIPFGLACFSTNNREPSQQDDFASGNSELYILSAAEVQAWTETLSGQVSS